MAILAIRAEDKNLWERRSPLVPDHIKQLLDQRQFKLLVETSEKRYFPRTDFELIGATMTEDISPADIILGVKEIPPEKILDDKVYLFFSHTIKGQSENMPLLQKILDSNATLIDYEKIVDDLDRRLLYYGKFAGDAGAVDILWLIGQELKRRGLTTPLSDIKQALEYRSLAHAMDEISVIADSISEQGFPEILTPFVVGIFGYGNVSVGSQEILDLFKVKRISPDELVSLRSDGSFDNKTLYLVVFKEEDMVRRVSGDPFDLQHYYDNPGDYEAITDPYVANLSLLINAVFWNNQYPHFFSKQGAEALWQKSEKQPFLAVADLSCDIEGGVEITIKSTDPGQPAFKYDPLSRTAHDDLHHDGILVLAVDNLPCEFAYDASTFFSRGLKEFVFDLLDADWSLPFEKLDLPAPLKRAIIAHKGALTPDFRYIQKYF